jgi:hypothetical protein
MQEQTNEPSIDSDNNKLRRWKADSFEEPFGISRITFLRAFAKPMEQAGVLHRPAGTRFWWGRARDIAAWITGEFSPTTRVNRGGR